MGLEVPALARKEEPHGERAGDQQLVQRLAKAEQLDGVVHPVAGLDEHAVVRNGDGNSYYLVCLEPGHESCSCPDYQQRQNKAGMPCKHLLATQLATQGTAEKPRKAPVKR